MISEFAKTAIVLGLLAAIGPFAIDMYLPALPTIAADLKASTAATQMTLMVFFVTFGAAQIVYGPVADAVGRKPPLYFGLAVFTLGGLGCAIAPDIGTLIACRFVQGLGAAVCMVIPRAVIRDLHTGPDAARLMSLVMLVFSVSPILAPLGGSGLIAVLGWRSVFVAAMIASLLGFLLVAFVLKETRPAGQRIPLNIGVIARHYATLLRHRRFLGLTFIGGFGMASFFAFLASSSFIYIDHFGLTPMQYSLAFSVNAVGFIGASQFAGWLAQRFGLVRVVRSAVTGYAGAAIVALAVTLAGVDNLAVLMAMLFAAFACLGLVIPSTMVLALEEHGPIAGIASALGGTLQFAAGAAVIVAASLLFDGTSLPMVGLIALCSVVSFILTRVTLRRERGPAPSPAAAE